MMLNRIPKAVYDICCHEYGMMDEAIKKLSARELFAKYCEWHGLLDWSSTLYQIVVDLRKGEEVR